MTYKTIQHAFVPGSELFGPVNTKLQAKEVGEFSITLNGKIGWWAYHHGCRSINVWRFSKL